MSKISAFAVLSEMADRNLSGVMAFPLNTNLKYAHTGRDGWGEITVAVPNHVIANINKYVGSLYFADRGQYGEIESELESQPPKQDEDIRHG